MPEITKGMKSIGPKALLPINTKQTVLDKQIQSIKSINRRNKIYLATGFHHNKISKIIHKYKNVNIINEKEYDKYNQCKHILNFIKYTDVSEDVFVINNGILFKKECFVPLKKHNKSTIYFLDKPKDNFNIGSESENSKYLFYDLSRKWSECVFLTKECLQNIQKANQQSDISNYFLFEAINMIYENTEIVENTISYRKIMKINNHTDLSKAKRFI